MIQNIDFRSYASYDPGSKFDDPVLCKWTIVKEWRIRVVASPNVCMWVVMYLHCIIVTDLIQVSHHLRIRIYSGEPQTAPTEHL